MSDDRATAPIGPPARITPALDGVPETLLWPLRSRAGMSVLDRAFFDDPMAVDLLNRIDYDFARFGPVNHWHAVRAKYSDDLIRAYVAQHPEAQILALGEGVETQFWRVDNGTLRWLSVDLPESIALRAQLLPEHPRATNVPLSALDPAMMDHVDASRGLFVTAAGLLMYFEPDDVRALLTRLAAVCTDLPGEVFFDTIPHMLSRRSLKRWEIDKGYVTPPMPFGLARREIGQFEASVPGLTRLEAKNYGDIAPARGRLIYMIGKTPILRNLSPMLLHGRLSAP